MALELHPRADLDLPIDGGAGAHQNLIPDRAGASDQDVVAGSKVITGADPGIDHSEGPDRAAIAQNRRLIVLVGDQPDQGKGVDRGVLADL
ncbi:MAG TPA: hypothetical protein VMW11_06395 [Candidatus Dormibacteraeota bacterium]|nr:hypothetical protein [Candidatus Dormibacteraeota bacterium]